jgi:hypothetical protein
VVEEVKSKRGRGPGKKPALMCTSIRLPVYVLKYFQEVHDTDKQKAMRQVLSEYVDKQIGDKDGNA